MKLQGIFPALTASFDHQGKLYKAKVLHNVEKLNDIALAGYAVCGSTGETPLLSTDERLELMGWVKEASAPGKTLIAGVGAESVHETVRLAKCAAETGYDAALVLTPFYYRNQFYRPETQALFFRAVRSIAAAGFALQHSAGHGLRSAGRDDRRAFRASQHRRHEG
jgi:4-hydroxy-2-oxoglutarate aldolase